MPTIKQRCFDAMKTAYNRASDGGRLPVHGRNMMYAVRQVSGLDDKLGDHYFLNGSGNGTSVLDQYITQHPVETASWDIWRDARGTLVPPYADDVPLGTGEVRKYLAGLRSHTFAISTNLRFSLDYPTRGPGDSFGAILYIEKEGFREMIAADGIQQRRDLAVASSKGYGNRATKELLQTLWEVYQVPIFVAHDFDKNGIGIAALLAGLGNVQDLGLRLDDVRKRRWGLMALTEGVSYTTRGNPYDPRPNLIERGASADEIAFLCSTARPKGTNGPNDPGEFSGRRVELNALIGRKFINWLEAKLKAHGVGKVVPGVAVLERAYHRAFEIEVINGVIAKARRQAHRKASAAVVPADLHTLVTEALEADPEQTWDDVIADLVRKQLP